MSNEELTPEELQALNEYLNANPQYEDKPSPFAFFKHILGLSDTLKAGNLTNEELGQAEFPVRTSQSLALFCKKMGMIGFQRIFEAESEIITASSLSRKGFLVKQSMTTRKETAVGQFGGSSKRKGLFSKKEKEDTGT